MGLFLGFLCVCVWLPLERGGVVAFRVEDFYGSLSQVPLYLLIREEDNELEAESNRGPMDP